MTSSIGRCGLGTVLIDCISSRSVQGRQIGLSGTLHGPGAAYGRKPSATELAAVLAEAERLSGYVANLDEPVIPLIWDENHKVDGFYKVADVNIQENPGSHASGIFPFTASLIEVLGRSSPQFEVIITGAQVTNTHTVIGESWMAYPGTASEQFYSLNCDGTTPSLRTADSGAIYIQSCFDIYSGILRYFLTPDDFYKGACKLYTDSPLELRVGTQIPRSPEAWRLDNGLVRITPSSVAGGSLGQLDIAHYDGAQWETAKTYIIAGREPFSLGSPHQAGRVAEFTNLTITLNAPETVSIRVSCRVDFGITWGQFFLDITLRRGDRNAQFFMSTSQPDRWSIYRATSEAATALTGGIRATDNDAGGNRYTMTMVPALTTDLAIGKITTSLATLTSLEFAIGMEVDGSAATSNNTAQRVVNQFFAAQSEVLRVVNR